MATVAKQAATYARATKLTPPPPAPSEMVTQMQRKLQKMAPMLMMLGFLIIVAGLIVGFYNASLVSDIFDRAAQDRASAAVGSIVFRDIHDTNVTAAWLPNFIFLGMGLLLFSIAVTLMGILGGLRTMGENVYNVLTASPKQG